MRTIKLRDIASPISINISNPSDCRYDKFVGLEHYDSGEFVISRYSDVKLLTSAAKEFRENDILIARRNVYLKRAGIVKFDGITSGDSIILRVNEHTIDTVGVPREIIEDYLPLVLNTEDFWLYANKHADGMNSKRISKDTLLDYEFMLPSEIEIKTISEKAWAAYRLKEAYKRLLVATDEMVKSQFIEMFGKYASTTRLEDLSETIIAGGDKPKDCTTDRTESNVYPVIANGIENDGIIGYSSSYRINSPSLTISARGTIGVTAIRSGMYTPIIRLIVIKPLRNINLTYLKYQLDYNGFQPTGAVQGQLTVPNVKNKMIPVPPLSEQEEFAAIVRQADKSKFELKKAIEAIDQVIKSLING